MYFYVPVIQQRYYVPLIPWNKFNLEMKQVSRYSRWVSTKNSTEILINISIWHGPISFSPFQVGPISKQSLY